MSDVDYSRADVVCVYALDDISKLLIPGGYELNQQPADHYFGGVCKAVSTTLGCSVWDLSVYQVPKEVIQGPSWQAVYAVFDNRNKQHIFLGYYGVVDH